MIVMTWIAIGGLTVTSAGLLHAVRAALWFRANGTSVSARLAASWTSTALSWLAGVLAWVVLLLSPPSWWCQ